MAEYQPFTQNELDVIREAGASAALIRVIDRDPAGCGAERNSTAGEVRKVLRNEDGTLREPETVAEQFSGGSFSTDLWNGHLMEAFVHADIDNCRILTREFGRQEYLVDARDHGDWSVEHARKLVTEKFEMYGPGTRDGPITPSGQ